MKIIHSFFLTLLFHFSFGQNLPEIQTIINSEIDSGNIPALALAVIESGELVHLSADGFKDLENKKEVDIHTAFHIASVSKTVICMAIFKLVEERAINLDVDINKYLPFTIQNPNINVDTITVRELLIHRSGIRDNYELYGPYWRNPKGDPKEDLATFLESYLHLNGEMYENQHFAKIDDRYAFSYCNTAYALLGLIIETVTQTSLEDYCQAQIFQKMGMANTSWFLKHLDVEQVAKTYVPSKVLGFQFKGYNGYPDYPAGQLRTSISDFSKLILGYLNVGETPFFLEEKTVNQITPEPPISHKGFHTFFLIASNNNLYYTHSGGDVGVRTCIMLDIINKNAIILFLNTEFNWEALFNRIELQAFSNE